MFFHWNKKKLQAWSLELCIFIIKDNEVEFYRKYNTFVGQATTQSLQLVHFS